MRGAAIALLVSQTITTGVTAYFAQRAYWIPYEVGRLLKVVGVSALTYAATALVAPQSLAWTVGLRAALLVVFPLGLLACRFFEPHEWTEIRRLMARMGGAADPQTLSAVPTDL